MEDKAKYLLFGGKTTKSKKREGNDFRHWGEPFRDKKDQKPKKQTTLSKRLHDLLNV